MKGFPQQRQTILAVWLLLLTLLGGACQQVSAPSSTTNPPTVVSKTAKPTLPTTPESSRVRTDIGFASRQKYLDHFAKHGQEFGGVSAEAYLRQAQTLRDRLAGKDVLEVVRADGVITRFDQTSGAFLAFNADLTIRTYFKPNDGVNYFWRQSRRRGN